MSSTTTNQTGRTSVEERVALLLAKAESTTPEEAEALTEHAERLMLRHGIEQATVAAARRGQQVRPEEIVEQRIPFTGVYGRALVTLGSAVAGEYGTVRTYYLQVRGATSTTLVLVGHESDVRAVETLVTSLVLQGRVALDRWWRTVREQPGAIGPLPVIEARDANLSRAMTKGDDKINVEVGIAV